MQFLFTAVYIPTINLDQRELVMVASYPAIPLEPESLPALHVEALPRL
jgi:hypothetical protein